MNKTIKTVIISLIALVLIGSVFFMGKYLLQSKNQIIDLNNKEKTISSIAVGEKANDSSAAKIPEDTINQEENAADTSSNIQPEKKEIIADKNTLPDNPAGENGKLKVINKLVSWGFAKSDSRSIDTIIIHSSYDAIGGNPYDLSGLIKEYKSYGVAPHYLIDRTGAVYKLVEEKNIAYHAGEGKVPDGRTGVNNFSIGIELMNTKTDKFTSEQYAALNKLIMNIKNSYKIKYVLGHSQIAPGRKDDPWNFDWKMIK